MSVERRGSVLQLHRHRSVRIVLIALVSGVVVAAASSLASAYFSASGIGAGPGSSGTAAAVSLAPGTVTATLYPGGTGTVTTVATNSNPGPVRITSLALDTTRGSGGFTVDAEHSGCTLTTFSFTRQTNGTSGWTVLGGSSLAITLPGALAATTATANVCQGATLTVHLTAGT